MKRALTTLFLLLVFLGLRPILYGQQNESTNIFENVPAIDRTSLEDNLNIYLEYHRTKNWSKVFDMFPRIYTQHPELTKDVFLKDIKKFGKRNVVAMSLENIVVNESIDGQYAIWGCARVKNGWSTSKWQATIYASIENKVWVFSDILFSFQLHARDPLPCSSGKK